jgi:hypothetical protein
MEQPRRFTGRQITVMVVAVCVAVIAAPIGAVAATGQLVNITDPVTASHKARVTGLGALQTTNWAGVPSGYVNNEQGRFSSGWIPLVTTTAGHRLAVTQVSLTSIGGSVSTLYYIENWIISSTGSCATPDVGNPSLVILRTAAVPANNSFQLTWSGPALYPPSPGTGKKACFGVTIAPPGDGGARVGVTGYRF